MLWVFLAVMAGDLAVPCLLAPFWPGYSHRTMVMSSIGTHKSPVRLWYNCWLVLGGVAFAAGSTAVYRVYCPVSGGG